MSSLGVWLFNNWQSVAGVGGLFLGLWRVHKVISGFESLQADTKVVREDVTLAMTNHLPHLQSELERMNENVTGMRTDIKDGLNRLSDSLNIILAKV